MNPKTQTYCLDSNVLIQAWQKYYSPNLCPGYWDMLNKLGSDERIFVPQLVYEEITRTDDDLSKWLKGSSLPVRSITADITNCLSQIYAANPIHKFLVDSKRGRSLADPWVISHAMHENAIVVTKEEKVTAVKSTKIKIPNVCENMSVRWINDFEMLTELKVRFSCEI